MFNDRLSFSVTKSNGAVVSGTAATGATGAAVYQLKLGRKDPAGVYKVGAKDNFGGDDRHCRYELHGAVAT